jgi:cytochrome c biogenesis protein ResB
LFSSKKKKIVFLLNHFGLWLVIFSAGLGSADLQRYYMNVNEGEYLTLGYNNDHKNLKFPFELKLIDFKIDEFPARLVWVDYTSYEIGSKFKNTASLIEKGKIYKVEDYTIKVEEYLPQAVELTPGNFAVSNDSFAGQAAKIVILNKHADTLNHGWISSGSHSFKSSYLPVDSNYFLAMKLPEPKRFSSIIEIKDSYGNLKNVKLEVNKPYKVDGWQLYQYSYDVQKGRYSKLSIIEAVRDPWIPVVYVGLFMLIMGSLLLFYQGRN